MTVQTPTFCEPWIRGLSAFRLPRPLWNTFVSDELAGLLEDSGLQGIRFVDTPVIPVDLGSDGLPRGGQTDLDS